MDIAFYISELLKEHDEVGIPGAGTIYRKKIAAAFNHLTQKFDPPSVRLDFTEKENERVNLVRYICKVKNISEPSADFFTRKFGSELKQYLETTGSADLHPLGKLRKNGSDYSVEQLITTDNTASYGLLPVSELVVSPEKFKKAPPAEVEISAFPFGSPEDSILDDKIVSDPVDSIPKVIVETEHYDKNETPAFKEDFAVPLFDKIVLKEKGSIWTSESEDPFDVPARKFRLNKKLVLYSSLVIILGSLGYAGYYFSKDLVDIYKTLASTPKALPEKYTPVLDKDTSLTLADSLAADSVLKSGSPGNSPSAVDNEEVVAKKGLPVDKTIVYYYELIGYSPLDQQDEDEFLKEMASKGLKVKVIKDPKGNKISMGLYDSEMAAMNDIPRFKKLMGESTYLYPLPVQITPK